MRAVRPALLFGTGLLAALGAGEILCRACVPTGAPLRFAQDMAELEALGRTEARAHFVPDAELFWRLAPSRRAPPDSRVFRGRIANAAGLREERELPSPKPPGELRALFLGDSCTFGTGLLPEESYVQVVEGLLSERLGRPVECINAGVPGWTLWQGWRALQELAPALEPDLVVLAFGWNDGSRWDGLSDEEHARRAAARAPPGALSKSRLCALVWERLAPAPRAAPGPPRPRVTPEEHLALLARAEHYTRRRGQGLLVLVWPVRANFERGPERTPRSAYQEVALAFGTRLDGSRADVLDLVPSVRALLAEEPLEVLYQDRVHATALAHRALAEPIAAWIAERWGADELAAQAGPDGPDPAATGR